MKFANRSVRADSPERSGTLLLLAMYLLTVFYGMYLLIYKPHMQVTASGSGGAVLPLPEPVVQEQTHGLFPNSWDLDVMVPSDGSFPYGVGLLLVLSCLVTAYFTRSFQRHRPSLEFTDWRTILIANLPPLTVSFFTLWIAASSDSPITGWSLLLFSLAALMGLQWSAIFTLKGKEKIKSPDREDRMWGNAEYEETPFEAVALSMILVIVFALLFPGWTRPF